MFRWCAYCQHFIGESQPLTDYSITHGVCEACEPRAEQFVPSNEPLSAQALFAGLRAAGRSGDEAQMRDFIALAKSFGLLSSETLIGVMQPALYEIGARWERGAITHHDERRFTELCLKIVSLMPALKQPEATAPLLLLAAAEGNRHDVGLHLLERIAIEDGCRCERLPIGARGADMAQALRTRAPAFFGLSVALAEDIGEAAKICATLAGAAAGVETALGGCAFRREERLSPPLGVPVLGRVDDFRAMLRRLRRAS